MHNALNVNILKLISGEGSYLKYFTYHGLVKYTQIYQIQYLIKSIHECIIVLHI